MSGEQYLQVPVIVDVGYKADSQYGPQNMFTNCDTLKLSTFLVFAFFSRYTFATPFVQNAWGLTPRLVWKRRGTTIPGKFWKNSKRRKCCDMWLQEVLARCITIGPDPIVNLLYMQCGSHHWAT